VVKRRDKSYPWISLEKNKVSFLPFSKELRAIIRLGIGF